MRLFRPLSWISQSRGNSPVASAEGGVSPMMAPSVDVANGFSSHVAAHNERVYGGPKRKIGDNTQKGNREITEFFSSSPMGSEHSKAASGPREVKKRKLNPLEETKSANTKSKAEAAMAQTPKGAERVEAIAAPRAKVFSSREEKRQRLLQIYTLKPSFEAGEEAAVEDADDERAIADLREMFQYQINLEMKLQHEKLNEIRCEIAKSQIVLEQLRRCHLIPFPQASGDPESMLQIMDGTGPSIPQANGAQPKWASPFGVTEGAYTRHYAKWLIPDPRFDGVAYEQPRGQGSGYPFPITEGGVRMDGRQTRNSFQLDPVPKTKRRSRGDIATPLQALSSGYAQKKEDAGPSVLKRGDGQWVKLVCIDCQRENFGSTQGFINHCRIAHRREFKSHEEAAVNSGHAVEVDRFGGLVGEEKTPATVVDEGLVHHKIRTAPIDWNMARDVLKHVNDALREFREGTLTGITAIPGETPPPHPSKDFAPSSSTPHLSTLLAKTGFDKSLAAEVAAAKAPLPEPTPYSNASDSDSDSDAEMEDVALSTAAVSPMAAKPAAAARAPILPSVRPSGGHAPILPPVRRVSRKSQGLAKAREVQGRINLAVKMGRVGEPAKNTDVDVRDVVALGGDGEGLAGERGGALEEEEGDGEMEMDELSPRAHSEGDKAPSLVSDDDDYTAESEASASEEESEGAGASGGEGVEVRDESDEARSRKRMKGGDREEMVVGSRGVGGKRREKAGKGRVGFVSPVKKAKKGRVLGQGGK